MPSIRRKEVRIGENELSNFVSRNGCISRGSRSCRKGWLLERIVVHVTTCHEATDVLWNKDHIRLERITICYLISVLLTSMRRRSISWFQSRMRKVRRWRCGCRRKWRKIHVRFDHIYKCVFVNWTLLSWWFSHSLRIWTLFLCDSQCSMKGEGENERKERRLLRWVLVIESAKQMSGSSESRGCKWMQWWMEANPITDMVQ